MSENFDKTPEIEDLQVEEAKLLNHAMEIGRVDNPEMDPPDVAPVEG